MKRSRKIAILTMGATAIALSACGGDDIIDVKQYADVAECTAGGTFDKKQCQDAFIEARDGYEAAYPKYASKHECEDTAGDGECEVDRPNAKARDQSWRPPMVAFIMAASRVQPQAVVPNLASPSGLATASGAPVTARAGAGAAIQRSAAARPQAAQVQQGVQTAKAVTASRGGFGSSSASASAGSGSAHGGG